MHSIICRLVSCAGRAAEDAFGTRAVTNGFGYRIAARSALDFVADRVTAEVDRRHRVTLRARAVHWARRCCIQRRRHRRPPLETDDGEHGRQTDDGGGGGGAWDQWRRRVSQSTGKILNWPPVKVPSPSGSEAAAVLVRKPPPSECTRITHRIRPGLTR